MSKPAKSQWDFGELFPPSPGSFGATSPTEQARKVLSVSELTTQIKRLLEKQVGSIWVTGEVTNLRAQSSGHIYFTLKDATSQLSCVLFRSEGIAHRELLQDGQKVLLQGDVTVYEARGQYQLIVRAVELQGVGALQIAFEKLKQKLAAEGLFASERKRPLPKYPQRIGLVTSPTGAAIRDVLNVVQRRNPGLEIILAPCRVQGEGAAKEIAAAIRLLNEFNVAQASGLRGKNSQAGSLCHIDLILLTRGAGAWKICGRSTRKSWRGRFLSRQFRSCRRSDTKLISPSAISSRTCARRRRVRRRKSSRKAFLPAASLWRI